MTTTLVMVAEKIVSTVLIVIKKRAQALFFLSKCKLNGAVNLIN
jgi:hypothetical protein